MITTLASASGIILERVFRETGITHQRGLEFTKDGQHTTPFQLATDLQINLTIQELLVLRYESGLAIPDEALITHLKKENQVLMQYAMILTEQTTCYLKTGSFPDYMEVKSASPAYEEACLRLGQSYIEKP